MNLLRMTVVGVSFCMLATAALAADDAREQAYKQLLKNSRKTGSYLEARELVLDLIRLVDESLQADDFPLASRCAHLAVESAEKTGNGLLTYQAQQKKMQVAACGKLATKIARHQRTLKTSPDDPDACLEVGRFVCALKDDWTAGCLLLQKTSALPWGPAATSDRSDPTDGAEQLRLARLWFDASKESPEYAAGFARRSLRWARASLRNGGAGNVQEVKDFLAELPIVYLIDLDEAAVKQGPWPLGRGNRGADATAITVGDIPSPNGLGLHASDGGVVSVTFKLNGQYKTFHGGGAICDHNGGAPSPVNFQVWGDGKPLWKSGMITRHGQAEFGTVPIRGVRVLELRIHAPGVAVGSHTCWLEPQLWK